MLSIHLAIGGCITKEKIVAIPTVITKGYWKGTIMAGIEPKNHREKYSKETFVKPNTNGRKMLLMSILRI